MIELNSAFSQIAGVLALAGFLMFVLERAVEFVIKPAWIKVVSRLGKTEEQAKALIPFVTIALGFLISLGFGLDLFIPLAAAVGLNPPPWVTQIFTALVVSGGSNFIHDIWPGSKTVVAR